MLYLINFVSKATASLNATLLYYKLISRNKGMLMTGRNILLDKYIICFLEDKIDANKYTD